ncbi:MAG: response regulator, partial [Deltaproteobacteria bacterium]|nr:response regulator [Deltaproteobacteria bacterium]
MSEHKTVLLVEDDVQVLAGLKEQFERAGWTVVDYERSATVKEESANWLPDVSVAVLDYLLSETDPSNKEDNGLKLGLWIKDLSLGRVSVALITAYGDEELAARAIKSGLDDYWPKGISSTEMLKGCNVLHSLSESRRGEAESQRRADASQRRADASQRQLEERDIPNLGSTPVSMLDAGMRRTIANIELHIAQSLMPVLIVGDTGTGKEAGWSSSTMRIAYSGIKIFYTATLPMEWET